MVKSEILEALIFHFCEGNKAKFAAKLGVKPQTINTWINRNTFDIDLVYSKCEHVSGDWLLTGNGEMLKSTSQKDESSSSTNESVSLNVFLNAIEKIQEENRKTLAIKDEKIEDLSREICRLENELHLFVSKKQNALDMESASTAAVEKTGTDGE